MQNDHDYYPSPRHHEADNSTTRVCDSTDQVIAGLELITLQRSRKLHALSRLGLWGVLIFTASAIALWQATVIWPTCPPHSRALLGASPTAEMIHAALLVYVISALVLTGSRHTRKTERYAGWSQIGFMLPFYFFYWYADILTLNFPHLTAISVLLLLLEHLRLNLLCRELLRHEYEEHSRKIRRIRLLSKH
ncbi:hypothetical protein [Geoalkalibacter subterraneus]|uniref:Menaquinol oxidoreductase n=1 Tax=Geoalkalibacter subterraneus TaxID=483547 RepID=A0A0B5FEP1_9BACT|nr:hypothetical protein [Geoalkalibacter subterraneus]AJF05788.1 hypothetical protein GSUB_03265 [Geoalkalibacter subterraneus]